MKLALFDFDGTITTKDSFFDFLIFSLGYLKLIIGATVLLPILILYKIKLLDNGVAKEYVVRFFFKNYTISKLRLLGEEYSKNKLPFLIRDNAMDKIKWHKSQGHDVVIVTATMDIVMKKWVDDNSIELIGTKLEENDGFFTGNFLSRNCYGAEKVKRIKENIDLTKYNYIFAYGDSKGDTEMLEIADEKYYKWKKI